MGEVIHFPQNITEIWAETTVSRTKAGCDKKLRRMKKTYMRAKQRIIVCTELKHVMTPNGSWKLYVSGYSVRKPNGG